MPLPTTLAAMKAVASSRRTVSTSTILTPADLGRAILVDSSDGVVTITLPSIAGNGTSGINAIGGGGEILILAMNGSTNAVQINGQDGDTFNGAARALSLGTDDEWVWVFSDGKPASPGDWLAIGNF